jgi:hypothetical protein
VLAGFFGYAAEIVLAGVVLPRQIAKGAKQRLEPRNLLAQEPVAARHADQVVQPAIGRSGTLDRLHLKLVARFVVQASRLRSLQPAKLFG